MQERFKSPGKGLRLLDNETTATQLVGGGVLHPTLQRGIVIPATAAMAGRRLAWSKVAAIGANVRAGEVGHRVLSDPEDKPEVEVLGEDCVVVREPRHPHAVVPTV